MATTMLNDLVNPEVMADMISAKLEGQLKFKAIAKVDNALVGRPGDTITVPSYGYIGMAEDIPENTAIPTSKLSTTTKQVTVKKAGKGVSITDEDVLSGYGDPVGEAEQQLLKSIAEKIDDDCAVVLENAVLSYAPTTPKVINYTGLVDAVDLFEEEEVEDKILYVNPKQVTQLRKDANFIRASELGDKVLTTGVIGEIAGCQVAVSKRVKLNEDKTAYNNFIVKEGALKIYKKRKVEIEPERKAEYKRTDLFADEHYAVALNDDTKVVKAKFKA